MSNDSKNAVSSRLSERTAKELADVIYRPGMAGFDNNALAALCQINDAHTVMLVEQGLIKHSVGQSLLRASAKIQEDGVEAIDLDPQFEDGYFAFESKLATMIGEDAGFLHTGRSRNDLGATLDRMRTRVLCLRMMDGLNGARAACEAKAAEHAETIMPGYTHLQPAQPITFGYFLTNVASALSREYDKVAAVYARINVSALGAAALAGTSFHIDRDRTANLLGFEGLAEPCLEAVASRDFVTELLWTATSALSMVSRVAQDMYVFCTHEFATISFPDRIAGTSSIMPQKKNMFALEYFRAASGRSIGALSGTLACIKGSNYSIGLDATREGITDAWPSLELFVNAMDLLRLIFECVEVKNEGLEQRCYENFSTATDLADGLVRSCGLSFREAHHVVGRAVQQAIDARLDASGMTVETINAAAMHELGRALDITANFVRDCLDPVRSVNARTTPGGTAPSEVRRMLTSLGAKRAKDLEVLANRRQNLDVASILLRAAIQKITS
ncbi:argininosuccinate lyase [Agrobacterium vitis]|uniref:argininosuccinate lyase n=1 Tax=Agrobacterium vitis TaxID=373 RepID=UPI000761DB5D|nr:argininosuccinate lyase [Agrobacterium vitis]KAA3517789.1 argininosuccinate lyase [Agrobacterium vitis]NOJ33067.1 argininosuccinate lyase [Agrobacterium vitis]RCU53376.1 argininosuccinate lyase [Agrobacterium vitis]